MRPNIGLRTLLLLSAWLVFENFNLSDGKQWAAHGSPTPAHCTIGHSSSKGRESCCNHAHPHLLPIGDPHSPDAYRIKTIVLDAGHGGKDPGCIGATAYEKHNTLAIVLQLGALIEANYPEVKVIYTRDTDVFVELNERAAIANRNNADVFISVHCNALSVTSAKGTETYVLGLHRSKDNLEVAKRENAAIYLEDDYQKNYEGYDPNSTEAHIIGSVWQSAYLEQSILLASLVQQFAHSEAEREDRGVKQAGFLVLRETAMPSVLVETGYLTNRVEEEYLASGEGREQMAIAIFKAFEAYKNQMEGRSPSTKPTIIPAKKAEPKTPPPAKSQPVAQKANVNQQPVAKNGTKPAAPKPEIFRILLLSWPNRLDRNAGQLGLLGDVKEENKEGKYHYFTGQYASRADAEKMLPEIKNLGFKTATIVQN